MMARADGRCHELRESVTLTAAESLMPRSPCPPALCRQLLDHASGALALEQSSVEGLAGFTGLLASEEWG